MDSVCPNRTKLPKHWHISKHQSVPKNLLVYLFSSHIPLLSTHDRELTTSPAVPSVIKSTLSPRERLSCCSPTSLLELETGGCSQRGAAGTFKHPDLDLGWMANSPVLSHGPGCPGAIALAHPQPGRQGGHGAADAPPSGGAGWVASRPPLHSSVLASGWSASGSLGRLGVRSQKQTPGTPGRSMCQ